MFSRVRRIYVLQFRAIFFLSFGFAIVCVVCGMHCAWLAVWCLVSGGGVLLLLSRLLHRTWVPRVYYGFLVCTVVVAMIDVALKPRVHLLKGTCNISAVHDFRRGVSSAEDFAIALDSHGLECSIVARSFCFLLQVQDGR